MSASLPLQHVFSNNTEKNTTGAQDWTEAYEAIRWIQLTMALLSVLGSASIIGCVALQRLSRTPELLPLFLLSVSDLLLALCWLIGAALFSRRCNSQNTLCYHLHTVEQIFYMASFFYTLNYVWNLFKGIREKFLSCMDGYPVQFSNRVSTAGKTTALLSCLVPVLLMTPVLIQGNISQCQANFSQPYRCLLMHTGALFLTPEQQPIRACGLLHTYRITIFLITFLLTLLSITVLLVRARRIYRRAVASCGFLGGEQQACVRVMERRLLLYPAVFLLCWGPAVALAVLRVLGSSAFQGRVVFALYIAQALTAASQGFLNCLVYGWTRAGVRHVGRRAFSRDVDTQTPLLRSQKKKKKRSYQTLRTVG